MNRQTITLKVEGKDTIEWNCSMLPAKGTRMSIASYLFSDNISEVVEVDGHEWSIIYDQNGHKGDSAVPHVHVCIKSHPVVVRKSAARKKVSPR